MIPYIALWVAMTYFTKTGQYWAALLLSIPTGLLVVRAFIIFHDCGHYNFFKSKKACKIVGTLLGVISFTPFHDWGKDHKLHHATSGNLDKRGFGDIWTLTIEEFMNASPKDQLKYKLYRHPLIMFIIGPILVFTVKQRLTRKHTGKEGIRSVHVCNILLLLYIIGLSFAMGGFWTFFLVQFPVIAVAAVAGVWMFYVQHQFEDTYWEHHEDWTLVESALEGSSFYKLPKWLQWMTGNIGFHHIHHLSPMIPNYKLEACYNDEEIFQEVEPLTIRRSLDLIWFRLWDEKNRKMVGWKALKDYQPMTEEVKEETEAEALPADIIKEAS